MRRYVVLVLASWSLSGCTGSTLGNGLPHGADSYAIIPASGGGEGVQEYRIGALDTIDVTVFQEPDLSIKGGQVDASGNINLPLVGVVAASGRTAGELARDLERRLGADYLKHPQVTVAVSSSVSQKVIVQGEVTEPGVYDIKGKSTLLEAISRAKGETRVAAVRSVAVFRVIKGERMGALFDMRAIRRGEAKDPELIGNDVVVVGYSPSRGIWRDTLAAAPLLNVFRPLGY